MAEEKLNIYQKLAKIRKSVAVYKKNKSGYGYKYTEESEILAKVTAGMDKYDLSLIPMVNPESKEVKPYQYVSPKGKDTYEIIVSADMTFRWVNNENPEEYIDVPWLLVGQQADAAQAMGAGLTYTNRYFMLKYFQSATTEDDPDNWRSKKRDAANEEDTEEQKRVTDGILALAKEKIAAGIDKEDVYKIIADNSGGKRNPNAIKDIETAKKVYELINAMEVTK